MASSSCILVKTSKYRKRPSPPYHASDCKGKVLKGNDKAMYKSVPDSRGIYKWVRANIAKTQKVKNTHKIDGKCYNIHDNYNVPFITCIDDNKKELTVYKAIAENNSASKPKMIPGNIIHKAHYKHVFVPHGSKSSKGNSIIAHISNSTYLHVGAEIYTFETMNGDIIEEYHSPLGNNDVPYPFAIGKQYIYIFFLGDYYAVPRELLDTKTDIGGQYYGFTVDPSVKTAIDKAKKKYKLKMIQKRSI